MGKLSANDLAHLAPDKISQLQDRPGRVRGHAGVELLPVAHYFDDRHLQLSTANASEQQRTALAALIAHVAPNDAFALSTALLNEFNSLGRIFNETAEALQRVIGSNDKVIGLLDSAHAANCISLKSEVARKVIDSTNQGLIEYLVASMGSLSTEQLRVIFLDRSSQLIGDEVMAEGTLTTLTAYPRQIIRRALELSACGLILVHNHPGGGAEPSHADLDFTRKLTSIGRQMEIEVKDHIIIAANRWFSFSRQGLFE